MDLGSAFLKLQRFSLDPKFSRLFLPHNHVYSDCSIWHLLSWLINYTSPKNDPVGWDFDPIRNFRSFEKEACFIPVQGILAEVGHPSTVTILSTQLPSRTPVATAIKRKWCQVQEGLQQDSFLLVTRILTRQTLLFLPPIHWRSIRPLYVFIHVVFTNKHLISHLHLGYQFLISHWHEHSHWSYTEQIICFSLMKIFLM